MRYLQVYENFLDSPDDVEIRWGREKIEKDHTIRNVIVSYQGEDITGQKPKTEEADEDLGGWNKWREKGQVVVYVPHEGDVAYIPTMFLPQKFQNKGIGKEIFKKISKSLGRPIRNEQEINLGDQTLLGRLFWLGKEEIRPDGSIVQKKINIEEIIPELVDEIPDSDMPSKTNIVKKIGDYIIYTEGWCDRCFSNYEELSRDDMVEKARKLTPERLKGVPNLPQYKEMFRGKKLKKWYFIPLDNNSVNYCLSVGVFR
jgi:hypothetical protein